MRITDSIRVQTDPDAVFSLLTDVERVVVCLPGATLLGSDGDTHRGQVRVRVGPIAAVYEGTVRLTDVDSNTRTLRLSARGSDVGGNGDAEASVDVGVRPVAGGSLVAITTDLVIRGRLAQFGKGAITVVARRLLAQFSSNLEQVAAADGNAFVATSPSPAVNSQANRPGLAGLTASDDVHVDQLDALSVVFGPRARRCMSVCALIGLGVVHGYWIGRVRTIERMHQCQR